jgi:hypothetical protein
MLRGGNKLKLEINMKYNVVEQLKIVQDILETKSQWEYTLNGTKWIDGKFENQLLDLLTRNASFRKRVWKISNEINGHVLPAGCEWTPSTGWKKEWLPEGYRPIMVGEQYKKGKAQIRTGSCEWEDTNHNGYLTKGNVCFIRTTEPIPVPTNLKETLRGIIAEWLTTDGNDFDGLLECIIRECKNN